MKDTKHLRFAIVAADIVLFTYKEGEICVRLIDCANTEDFPNKKCLPGGLIYVDETSDEAITRILKEKTNTPKDGVYFEQLKTYSGVKRDPRGRVIAIGYVGVINKESIKEKDLPLFVPCSKVASLAYDHTTMLKDGLEKLRDLVMTTNVLFMLLGREFTILELQQAFETVTGEVADKRNFLKKLKATKALKDTHKKRKEGAHRPASIFTHSHKTIVKQVFF